LDWLTGLGLPVRSTIARAIAGWKGFGAGELSIPVGVLPSWGGVCHGAGEKETYRELCALVREEVEDYRLGT
jgi:hypothetical protein